MFPSIRLGVRPATAGSRTCRGRTRLSAPSSTPKGDPGSAAPAGSDRGNIIDQWRPDSTDVNLRSSGPFDQLTAQAPGRSAMSAEISRGKWDRVLVFSRCPFSASASASAGPSFSEAVCQGAQRRAEDHRVLMRISSTSFSSSSPRSIPATHRELHLLYSSGVIGDGWCHRIRRLFTHYE